MASVKWETGNSGKVGARGEQRFSKMGQPQAVSSIGGLGKYLNTGLPKDKITSFTILTGAESKPHINTYMKSIVIDTKEPKVDLKCGFLFRLCVVDPVKPLTKLNCSYLFICYLLPNLQTFLDTQ